MAKILIIDDDAAILKLVGEVLSDAGYEVEEAMDASSGFAAAHEKRPDIILSDFIMPGMIGLPGKTLFDELSADPRTKDIPVIITSCLSKKSLQKRIPERLWPYIMSKPFDFPELRRCIGEILKRAS